MFSFQIDVSKISKKQCEILDIACSIVDDFEEVLCYRKGMCSISYLRKLNGLFISVLHKYGLEWPIIEYAYDRYKYGEYRSFGDDASNLCASYSDMRKLRYIKYKLNLIKML